MSSNGLEKSLGYLLARGFGGGEAVWYKNEIRYRVNGAFLKEWQVETLAAYESCKDRGEGPDGLGIGYMAEACRRVAEHGSLNAMEADEGRELFERIAEWRNPWNETPVEQLRVLCKRMAYFLTRNFVYLWPECLPAR